MKREFNSYKNYVCPHCFNQLDKCTCDIFPPYTLIEIDVEIQKIIRVLNGKGYRTKYSCASHYNTSFSIYIKFVDNYNFDTIPNGYKYKDGMLEHSMKNRKNEDNFNNEKNQYIKILEEWIMCL